jgi:hypothetical protein
LIEISQAEGHRFTYEYAQPDGYRFCQDSVILPMFVARDRFGIGESPAAPRVEEPASCERKFLSLPLDFRVLDVCAGCGVVGLELAHYVSAMRQVDFLEVQPEFASAFQENLRRTDRSPSEFRWLEMNYGVLSEQRFSESYDLIVGNPPYFTPGEGQMAPGGQTRESESRTMQNRCRFFLDGDLRILITGVANALRPGGRAYLLVKSGTLHGRDALRDVRLWTAQYAVLSGRPLTVDIPVSIRGTPVVQISRG